MRTFINSYAHVRRPSTGISLMLLWLLISGLQLMMPTNLLAVPNGVRFYATVSPSTGGPDQEFTLSFNLEGSQAERPPRIRGGEEFEVRYIGPQTSVRIINGVADQKTSFLYRIRPTKEGLLETPIAIIESNGSTLQTKALQVLISRTASNTQVRDDSVFLKHTTDKSSVYVGEQIVSTLDLAYKVRILEPKIVEMAFDGFWQEEMGDNETVSKTVKGQPYRVTQIKRAIYPLKPGKLGLAERKINVQVPDPNRRSGNLGFDPFDPDFFSDLFGRNEYHEVSLVSNIVELEVKPLPAAPANFPSSNQSLPIVGHTDIEVKYPGGDIKVGESKTIELLVTSLGNINGLNELALASTDSYRVYQETPQKKTFLSAGNLVMRKTLKISLVALKPGPLHIPGIRLGYFDPIDKEYKIAQGKPIDFNVSGQAAAAASSQDAVDQSSSEQESPAATQVPSAESPKPQATEMPKYREPNLAERVSEYLSPSFILLLLFIFAVVVTPFYFLARGRNSNEALRLAFERVRAAKTLDELSIALREYILSKLEVGGNNHLSAVLQVDQVRKILSQKLSDQALVLSLQTILDRLEAALYGDSAQNESENSEFLDIKQSALRVLESWK